MGLDGGGGRLASAGTGRRASISTGTGTKMLPCLDICIVRIFTGSVCLRIRTYEYVVEGMRFIYYACTYTDVSLFTDFIPFLKIIPHIKISTLPTSPPLEDLNDSSRLSVSIEKFVADTVTLSLVTPGCLLDLEDLSRLPPPGEGK